MKKAELTKIIKFIESEIHGYDIEFDYEIENEIVTVGLDGAFTDNQSIQIMFQIKEDKILFDSMSDIWIEADARTFWIEFMTRIYQ